MILCPSHTTGTVVRGLDMTFPSFSDLFRVVFAYSVLSPSFQLCRRARVYPAQHAFAQPHLGSRCRFKVTHHCVVSILCHVPGRPNGLTSPPIHGRIQRYISYHDFREWWPIQRRHLPINKQHRYALFRLALASSKAFHPCIVS